MAQQGGQCGERGALHLEVADLSAIELEGLDLGVQIRVGQRETERTTLRTVEAAGGDGDAAHDVVLGDAVGQLWVGGDGVGAEAVDAPAELRAEGSLEREVADALGIGVEVGYAIKSDGTLGGHVGADRRPGLQTAAGANAHHGQHAGSLTRQTGGEVDVGEGVELVDDDVDVVAADAVREDGEAFAGVVAGDAVELTVADVALDVAEVLPDHSHTVGIAHQHDAVGQLFRSQVQMKDAAVAVDDQFGRRDGVRFRIHNSLYLMIVRFSALRARFSQVLIWTRRSSSVRSSVRMAARSCARSALLLFS